MTTRKSFSYRVSELLALLCWSLLYLLRNRRQSWLTREEIRLARFSFSHFGEDLVIEELINQLGIERGFYVDVGAFDPVIVSNTLLLFKRGWSGINIDVDEQKIERFRRFRPRDWNLACGVSKTSGRKQFAHYAAEYLTRLITETDDHSVVGDLPLETFEAETKPLNVIMEDSPFRGQQIDFLNIDCEGSDLEVLESLDFPTYQPRLVAVEAIDPTTSAKIKEFMNSQGYAMTHRLGFTRIFVPRTEVARLGLDA
jgi:FkbM family methyltransferase